MFLDAIPNLTEEEKKQDIREFLRKVDDACQGFVDASKISILVSKMLDNSSKMIAISVTKVMAYFGIH